MQHLKTVQCSTRTKTETSLTQRENTLHSRTLEILIIINGRIQMTPAKINALKLPMNFRNHVDDALEYTFVGILQHNLKVLRRANGIYT